MSKNPENFNSLENADILKDSKEQQDKLSTEKLQSLNNNDFLKIPQENRLQYITQNKITSKDLVKDNLRINNLEFNFTFKGVYNKELWLKTTAGQVLPQEVGKVESNGITYIRNNLKGEFFAVNGSRLIINQGTKIEIAELRDISKLKDENNLKIESYLKDNKGNDSFQDIISEAINRGVDLDFALKSFKSIVEGFSLISLDRKSLLEDLFTDLDRKKGNKNYSEKINLNNITHGIKGLLDFISIHESGGNYNAIFGNSHQNNIDFTNYSLRDILSYQEKRKKEGKYTAIGKYQFINSTLSEMINKYNFNLDQKFSPDFQDKLAIIRLKKRGLDDYISGKLDRDGFQKRLSKEWASLPKDSSGLSYYAKDGINKAYYTNNAIDNVLDNLDKIA